MSRHTLDDGITPDPNITSDSYDEHNLTLAPPGKLIGPYIRGNISFEEYKIKYIQHLRNPKTKKEVETLAKRAFERNVAILCKEQNPEKCHRKILAEECKRIFPQLEVDIKKK